MTPCATTNDGAAFRLSGVDNTNLAGTANCQTNYLVIANGNDAYGPADRFCGGNLATVVVSGSTLSTATAVPSTVCSKLAIAYISATFSKIFIITSSHNEVIQDHFRNGCCQHTDDRRHKCWILSWLCRVIDASGANS